MAGAGSGGSGTAPFEWGSAAPEAQGFSAPRLEQAREALQERQTRGLLVIRDDLIVCEWYASGWDARRPHFSASLAKAVVGGMTLLVALSDGRLKADDPAARYVPAWREDAHKSRITLRHLATHTSGIEDAEQGGLPHEALPGWKGEFWRLAAGGAGRGAGPERRSRGGTGAPGSSAARGPGERDPFTIARDVAPVVFPPGTRYAYSNPGIGMLGYCVTAAMQGTAEPDLHAMMLRRVFGPLGVSEAEWSIGYNTPYVLDGLTLYAGWGGGAFTPRAVARVARLLLEGGRWQGTTLLPEGRVRQALSYAGLPLPDRRVDPAAPASGLAWYGNQDGAWPGVPRDAFAGAGAQHQLLLAVPSLGLIVVRNGGRLERPTGGAGFWSAALRHVFRPVVDAIV